MSSNICFNNMLNNKCPTCREPIEDYRPIKMI